MTKNLFRALSFAFAVALLSAAGLAQDAPTLTEVERLRWELAAARSQLHAALAERDGCRVQLVAPRGEAVRGELAQLKAAVEAAHPGHVLDVEKGVLLPKPPAEAGEKP